MELIDKLSKWWSQDSEHPAKHQIPLSQNRIQRREQIQKYLSRCDLSQPITAINEGLRAATGRGTRRGYLCEWVKEARERRRRSGFPLIELRSQPKPIELPEPLRFQQAHANAPAAPWGMEAVGHDPPLELPYRVDHEDLSRYLSRPKKEAA